MAVIPLSNEGTESLWLASYPRSGNTFLRIVLNQVFGLQSTGINPGEIVKWNVADGLADLIGHFEHKDLSEMGRTNDSFPRSFKLVKTHDAPINKAPAIYIVRDGRASIVSYFHYLRDIQRDADADMADLILGRNIYGSWSSHFRSWDPTRRPNTLLLKYEDLRDSTTRACERISEFLQRPQTGDFDLTFEDLHKIYPNFFRSGNNERNIAEMKPHLELFDSIHGETMRELGYY